MHDTAFLVIHNNYYKEELKSGMDVSGYFAERVKSKIYMRVFTLGVIICLLPIAFIYYGLFEPSAIEWVLVFLAVFIGSVTAAGSLYKYWIHKQRQHETIE